RPHMTPLSSAWNEKAEAGSGRAADALPLLEDRAASVLLRDGVVADQRAVDVAHFPAAEPKIELGGLGQAGARMHAGAHVANDTLEPRIRAKRVELRPPLEHLSRPGADVVGDIERLQGLLVTAESGEVQRALDLDHRFRRLRGPRRLERLERRGVVAELPLRLRDAEQAQPVLRVLGEQLPIA